VQEVFVHTGLWLKLGWKVTKWMLVSVKLGFAFIIHFQTDYNIWLNMPNYLNKIEYYSRTFSRLLR